MRKILTVLLSLVFLFASFTGAVVVFATICLCTLSLLPLVVSME